MVSPSNPLAVATTQNIGNLITSLQLETNTHQNCHIKMEVVT